MEFKNFENRILNDLQMHFADCTVKMQDVQKNNGIIKHGVTIISNTVNISPTIYIDAYYEQYCRGNITIEQVVSEVIEGYERNKTGKSVDISFFTNFEHVKDRIAFKLINTKSNEELLKDIPAIPYHDLSIVFYYLVDHLMEEGSNATILIHNAHMNLWNVNTETLYELAKENTPKLKPYHIENMRDTIKKMIAREEGEEVAEQYVKQELSEQNHMYVLTNTDYINGACVLLYPNVLRDFSYALHDDLYILPSSVHETILLPASEFDNASDLIDMVSDVNETAVDAEEILSNQVYYYNRAENKVSMMSMMTI